MSAWLIISVARVPKGSSRFKGSLRNFRPVAGGMRHRLDALKTQAISIYYFVTREKQGAPVRPPVAEIA
jgi:hypothetical protein